MKWECPSLSRIPRNRRAVANHQRREKRKNDMTFEEEINRFFKNYELYQRKTVESDVFYQLAVKEQNAAKAIERAIELLPGLGNVKTKREQRKIIRKQKRGDFDDYV
jgi:ABC-type polar amino acid transport system ATPase subunit